MTPRIKWVDMPEDAPRFAIMNRWGTENRVHLFASNIGDVHCSVDHLSYNATCAHCAWCERGYRDESQAKRAVGRHYRAKHGPCRNKLSLYPNKTCGWGDALCAECAEKEVKP